MKRYLNRRTLALTCVVLASQGLSACIILPRPYLPRPFHHHPVVVIGAVAGGEAPAQGAYGGQSQGGAQQ